MLDHIHRLRGIVALLVVGFHYKKYLNEIPIGMNLGDYIFRHGYMGVDIFFLISGFIITYSTQNATRAHPVDFALKRFFRIAPLAWMITLLFAWLLAWPFQRPDMVKSFFLIPMRVSQPPFYGYSVVAALWTLSYEFVFYLIFTIALTISHKLRTLIASAIMILSVILFQIHHNAISIWDAQHAALPESTYGIIPD
jgi:exopolysaccharide production protein ExoZ